MSGDKLREAEAAVEKADKAALEVAAKYEWSPDFENSEDLKRAVHVLQNPDKAYAQLGLTGQPALPMSVPSDIFAAWRGTGRRKRETTASMRNNSLWSDPHQTNEWKEDTP